MDVTSADGAFYSNGAQLGIQLLGVLVAVTWSVLWTYLLSWLIRLTVSDLIFGLDLFEWKYFAQGNHFDVPFRGRGNLLLNEHWLRRILFFKLPFSSLPSLISLSQSHPFFFGKTSLLFVFLGELLLEFTSVSTQFCISKKQFEILFRNDRAVWCRY